MVLSTGYMEEGQPHKYIFFSGQKGRWTVQPVGVTQAETRRQGLDMQSCGRWAWFSTLEKEEEEELRDEREGWVWEDIRR